MMEGFPESIRHEQMAAACEALGLPAKRVGQLSVDVQDGLIALVYLTDSDGKRIHHAGDYVTTTLRIPVDRSPRQDGGG